VIFVERARHLRRHPGQIAFPGGAADAADGGDPTRTALREAEEEIGIERARVRVVGRLPDSRQELNRFIITPVVGVLDAATRFRIDGEEIASIFAVPLSELLADGAVYEDPAITTARGKTMYAFDCEGRHIWGFTGRILKSFVDAWNAPESPLRRAAEEAF
jgi:8-oxo-dGTP pyrophosphatase MutT (NUDIX family)